MSNVAQTYYYNLRQIFSLPTGSVQLFELLKFIYANTKTPEVTEKTKKSFIIRSYLI